MNSLIKRSSLATRPTLKTCIHCRESAPSQASLGAPARLAAENIAIFWLRFAWETLYKHLFLASTIGRLLVLKTTISRNPYAKAYRDQSMMPVADDEEITLDLLTKTTGASAAVAHLKKVAELTGVGQGAPRAVV
jgi:hypothetical protein